jgi:hypothetical protein
MKIPILNTPSLPRLAPPFSPLFHNAGVKAIARSVCLTAWIGAATVLVNVSMPVAQAGLAIPYTQDQNTLHLWHLNDTNGLYANDAATNLTVDDATPIQLENLGEPIPTQLPYSNTSLGSPGPGYPGLTNSYSGTTKQHVLAGNNGSFFGGQFPDVTQFCNPVTGAFTFEAVINVNSVLASIDAEILAGDNASASIGNRGWQWRLENGAMEWDLLAGSTDNDFKPLLPTTGPDAARTNAWFHMAITFTGQSPTNGNPTNVLTMYWTPLDPTRTYADVLAQYTNDIASPTGIRPLSGAPEGDSQPALGIGGSARSLTSNPGNGEGLIGSILEVRVSDIARASNDMAFTTGGPAVPPTITTELPSSTLVGYGQPLIIGPVVSGTQPLTYMWYQNGTLLPDQTSIDYSNVTTTFASAGSYSVIITNTYGSVTSSVELVTIGAIASSLYPTGIGTNGQPSAADIADAHYTMTESSDPNFLGPEALVYEWNNPIQFSPNSGSYASTNGYSTWIGLQGNQGGVINSSPAGAYTYRTTFVLDQANPATVTLQGDVIFTGTITNILVNGQSTGISLTPINGQYIPSLFTISNGFEPGLNTLDFCQNLPSAENTAIYVEQISAVGQALAPGFPVITQQPANQTVRDANLTGTGSAAEFSVIATGRPPLTYQWWVDGSPLNGATNYTLDIYNPSAGAQGTNYSVVVANGSGPVTSSSATLTIVPTNQPPVTPTLNLADFTGQGATIQLTYLIGQLDSDPDHDPLTYVTAATSSTNGAANGFNNVVQNGTALVYTPVPGYIGADQFTYTVQDSLGATTVGVVNVLELTNPAALTTVLVGGTTNLGVGVTSVPAGYSFQWQLDGTNLSGTTTAQLVITNAQAANAGDYVLSVTDGTGTEFNSSPSRVALDGAPMPKFNVNPLDWIFYGYGAATTLNGSVLNLTDGVLSEGRSAWYGWPQEITNFSASFIYQDVGGLGADGFAFVLQTPANGNPESGAGGGGLGYSGIGSSVALEFNIYAPNTVGFALQADGTVSAPFTPIPPINLASGDPIAMNISYSAGVADLTLTDLTTLLSTNMVINVANVLGAAVEDFIGTNFAYVGFTSGDGGVASTQTIRNFAFMPQSLPLAVQQTTTNSLVLSWAASYSGFVLQSSASLEGSWQNVTAPVTVVGEQFQVVTPLTPGAQFYRLILP